LLRFFALPSNNLEALAVRRFGKLSAAETLVCYCARKGKTAGCGPNFDGNDVGNDPAQSENWGSERTIRAELISWLCVEPEPSGQVDRREVQVYGAKITDNLDLSYATVPFPLVLLRCLLTADAKLTHVRIPELALNGSHTRCLLAEGAEVKGNLLLQHGFSADGEVRLIAAEIGSTLNCEGSTFSNPAGATSGACSDPREEHSRGKAIRADRIKVEGAIFLRKGFTAYGEVMLNGARVGGDLSCKSGKFKNLQGTALSAEKANVGGNVYLDGSSCYGTVDLFAAKIGGSLNCLGGTFDQLILNTVTVRDVFVWGRTQNPKVAQLDLQNAAVGALADDEKSWPARGNVHLDGFEYERISSIRLEESFWEVSEETFIESEGRSGVMRDSPTDARTRLMWLDRDAEFKLQPYHQLAKVLNGMGDDGGAKQVLSEMEIRARASARRRLILPRRMKNFSQDLILRETVGYGLYPLRSLWSLGALWLVGWILFRRVGVMAPTDREAYQAFRAHCQLPEHYPPFSATIYSLENCVPLVKLGQDDRWQPDPNPRRCVILNPAGWRASLRNLALRLATSPSLLRWTRWLMIGLGWLLATFLVAGLVGIIKVK
jgi:hypothetical protein